MYEDGSNTTRRREIPRRGKMKIFRHLLPLLPVQLRTDVDARLSLLPIHKSLRALRAIRR